MRAGHHDTKLKPLTPRQANALQMTLDGYTKGEIQERLGITQVTLWRWRQLPAWDEQVSLVLRDYSGDGQGQIKSMLPLATRRLKQLIHSQSETVALGACRTVLEAHANLIAREEQTEMMQRLEGELAEMQQAIQTKQLSGVIEAEIGPFTHENAQEQPLEVSATETEPGSTLDSLND